MRRSGTIKNRPTSRPRSRPWPADTNIPELLGKAIAARPELEDAYLVLGNYYYLSGDIDQAIVSYKSLLEKFAGSANKADYETFLKKLEAEKAAPEVKK